MNLSRVKQEIFGEDAGVEERAQIGSLAAGSPVFTTDPETMQSLQNFKDGIRSVSIGDNSPPLEDINSLYYLLTRQLAYVLQKGIAEWHEDETYYENDHMVYNGKIYKSKLDDNINNLPKSDYNNDSNWEILTPPNDYENILLNMATREWTSRTAADTGQMIDLCYGLGLLVIVTSLSPGVTNIMTSPNGINWTARATPDTVYGGVCFSESLELFVGVGAFGSVMTSSDGITWASSGAGIGGGSFRCSGVKWIEELELFIAYDGDGTSSTSRIATSPNGATWTVRTTPDVPIFDIVWSPTLEILVGVGVDQTETDLRTVSSEDGVTWTARYSAATPGRFNSVVWNSGLFIAFGGTTDTDDGIVFTSSDGITWSVSTGPFLADTTTPLGSELQSVVWSEELKAFIATVSPLGGTSRIATSQDGVFWRIRSTPSLSVGKVYWAKELSLAVAIGKFTANNIITSK